MGDTEANSTGVDLKRAVRKEEKKRKKKKKRGKIGSEAHEDDGVLGGVPEALDLLHDERDDSLLRRRDVLTTGKDAEVADEGGGGNNGGVEEGALDGVEDVVGGEREVGGAGL